nr:sensor histidine kinase [Paenibacillus sp. ACRRY]
MKEEKLYINLIRILGTLLLALSYYYEYINQAPISLIGGFLVLLLYMVLIWAETTWWNEVKYYVVSMMIISIILVLHYVFDSPHITLLWPLYFIILMMNRVYPRVSLIMGLITLSCIAWVNTLSLSTILGLLGVMLVARSIKIRRDAHLLTTLHLKELDRAHQELEVAHKELQEATVHSIRYAALEERTRLAREIHDGLGHQLTSLIVQLQALQIMHVAEPEKASDSINQLLGIARQAMAEVRVAVKEWTNDEMGLGIVALKGLVSQTQGRSSVQFKFNQNSELSEWPIETSIVLYRVLQESLTNILRHSDADQAWIDIDEAGDRIQLTVTDNGTTEKGGAGHLGYGLNGIIKRCEEWGGSVSISSVEPHGFRVKVMLPVERMAIVEEKE